MTPPRHPNASGSTAPAADLLSNPIRPYAWGSTTAIATLTGRTPTGAPEAELWLGAHPAAPSRLDRGTGPQTLTEVVAADPARELGRRVADRFDGELPFLLKVLAAEQALSVQVHPTAEQARAGHHAEEAAGIPSDAPHRLYRDRRHKPEMLHALGEFHALCGFRAPAATAELLAALHLPALDRWIRLLRTAEPERALRTVLTEALGPATAVADGLPAALAAAAAAPGPHTAAYAAYARAAHDYPGDRGLAAALLLNHVVLRPGETLYLDARVPHAYLHGTGVELMANSDNVLRCGLTPKHVDVPELLRVVDFRPAPPHLVPGRHGADGETHYPSPAPEFALSRIDLDGRTELHDDGPQLLLCTGGTALLRRPDRTPVTLRRGAGAYLSATGGPVGLTGTATLFRARVPA